MTFTTWQTIFRFKFERSKSILKPEFETLCYFSAVVPSDITVQKSLQITASVKATTIAPFPSLSRKFTRYLMYMRVLTLPDGLVSFYFIKTRNDFILRFLLSVPLLSNVWLVQCNLLDTCENGGRLEQGAPSKKLRPGAWWLWKRIWILIKKICAKPEK